MSSILYFILKWVIFESNHRKQRNTFQQINWTEVFLWKIISFFNLLELHYSDMIATILIFRTLKPHLILIWFTLQVGPTRFWKVIKKQNIIKCLMEFFGIVFTTNQDFQFYSPSNHTFKLFTNITNFQTKEQNWEKICTMSPLLLATAL